jgi:hypothetical protein
MERRSSFFWTADDNDNDQESVGTHDTSASTDIVYASDDANLYYNQHQHQHPDERDIEGDTVTTSLSTLSSAPLLAQKSYGSFNGNSSSSANHGSSDSLMSNTIPSPPPRNATNLPSQSFHKSHADEHSIRFQVVLWHIGPVSVQLGSVPMQFRITLFWNDCGKPSNTHRSGLIASASPQRHLSSAWTMQGRQLACLEDVHEGRVRERVDVPPVSILNAIDLTVMGTPEVAMIRKETRLMRYVCTIHVCL